MTKEHSIAAKNRMQKYTKEELSDLMRQRGKQRWANVSLRKRKEAMKKVRHSSKIK